MPVTGTPASSSSLFELSEVKSQLRIDIDADDTLLQTYIDAAVSWAEQYRGEKFLTETQVDYLDEFPVEINPVWFPLVSVTSIAYLDINGDSQTLDSSVYQVDANQKLGPGRIRLAYNQSWPSQRGGDLNAVTITYKAGYGDTADDVPGHIKQGILMLIGSLYENREATSPITITKVPYSVKDHLGMNRRIPI
jgi:uncharacterized phiE125 gp8 family phage protein